MPESLRDGRGRGYLAAVTAENRLQTNAVVSSAGHHTNLTHGDTYAFNFSATPTGAGDCFLYLLNSNEKEIIVEGISIYAATAEKITIYGNQNGTPVGGAAVTPANMHLGSNNVADGTFQHGNDITGMSGGTILMTYRIPAGETRVINFESDIIIPNNKNITIYATTGGIALEGFIDFWHEHGGSH